MSGPPPRHVPVLPAEVLDLLAPAPGQVIVDATLGAGGHARLLAERVQPGGRVIGLDQDPAMIDLARPRLEGLPVNFFHANFDRLRDVLDELHLDAVDAVLADLGFCSDQMDEAGRGLSFQQEGPLDMRLDPSEGEPASALLRRLNERELADMIYQLGEERFSRRIARKIVETRREDRSRQRRSWPTWCAAACRRPKGKRAAIDPATRTFQALRIAVNDELGALDRLLAVLPSLRQTGRSGGRHQLPLAGGPPSQARLRGAGTLGNSDAQTVASVRSGSGKQPAGTRAPSCGPRVGAGRGHSCLATLLRSVRGGEPMRKMPILVLASSALLGLAAAYFVTHAKRVVRESELPPNVFVSADQQSLVELPGGA